MPCKNLLFDHSQQLIKQVERQYSLAPNSSTNSLKQALSQFSLEQEKIFFSNCLEAPIASLIQQRAYFLDHIINLFWREYALKTQASIIAIGGYGRAELFPHSDIDLLILFPQTESIVLHEFREIMHVFWDSGLEIKTNIYALDECEVKMKEEIILATSFLESRFISGNQSLYQNFKLLVNRKLHNAACFVSKKKEEQSQRHAKYNNAIYLLEPNIKESPCGLRDVQTAMWIAHSTMGVSTFAELTEKKHLSEKEYHNFTSAIHCLWRFRFALHSLTQRDENRLLFDLQIRIAEKFGYKEGIVNNAVELCMQVYYKQMMVIRRICSLLLQEMEEYSYEKASSKEVAINEHFHLRDGLLVLNSPSVFKHSPAALLEIFLLAQSDKGRINFAAQTSKKIIEAKALINYDFRQNEYHNSLFIQIVQNKEHAYQLLNSMHEHGILSAYIHEFAHVEGLMQFDLFHTYTVDAHTLIVLRQLALFFNDNSVNKYQEEYQIAQTISKPELLILAGLFHDIAKGNEEEHQFLGAKMALKFCQEHELGDEASHLVSWLIRCHLELSLTAQKMNIYDPYTWNHFLQKNAPKEHCYLDYLYLLTIADISATAPHLLNDYKHSLIKQLWQYLKEAIQQDMAVNIQEKVIKIKENVTQKLQIDGYPKAGIQSYFDAWDEQYVIEQSEIEIIKQVRLILDSTDGNIAINIQYNKALQAVELLIWIERTQYQFALITAFLDTFNYSIIRAQVKRDEHSYVLYSFMLRSMNAKKEYSKDELLYLKGQLKKELNMLNQSQGTYRYTFKTKKRLEDRRVQTLPIKTKVYFDEPRNHQYQSLNLITKDRPGLLALIGKILGDLEVLVVGAYVTTVGGRVEDKFYLLDSAQQTLSIVMMEKIIDIIKKKLK